MDPITAISLASSLISFVDFATKIVAGTYEVYNSATGTTVENADIDAVISDLKEAATDLEIDLPGKSKHDRALKELACKCQKAAKELLKLLNRIKVDNKHSSWKSLKATVISMRKQKEIAGLEKRLNSYRSQILMRLTLILHDQNSLVKLKLDELENTTLNLSSESALRATALREDILRDITDLLDQKIPPSDTADDSRDRLLEVESSLKALLSLITTVPRENEILKHLYCDSLDLRERSIITADEGTFKWIFEEDDGRAGPAYRSQSNQSTPANLAEDEQPRGESELDWHKTYYQHLREEELQRHAQTRRLFMSWLSSGNGVFHLSGKAGSGKSTLMKFICHHERTKTELKKWAGQKKLVFASFYFWKSQDKMQMSLEGLYRSILFTTLKQCPELIPVVFPAQWKQLKGKHPLITGNFINFFDLTEAFEAIATTDAFPNHRFCYFVDGLDEYQGRSLDHIRLAKSLQKWASSDDVKICASSRPYIEYDNLAPRLDQRFCLHELTRHDIYLFSREMIEKDSNFEHIKNSYLDLVMKVVERSEGVFLWARLAINSLLVGMLRHDNLRTLEKKLDVIPGDLNQLYDQLLNSLDEDDRERAIKMLLLTAHNPFTYSLSSIMYWWLDNLGDLECLPRDGVKPPSWPSAKEIMDNARLQIKSLTKGLLETSERFYRKRFKRQTVHFFHRTVRDFVIERLEPAQKSGKYDRVLDAETYHLLLLAELTTCDIHYRRHIWNIFFLNDVVYHKLFPRSLSLSLDMMDVLKCLLDNDDTPISADLARIEVFIGAARSRFGWNLTPSLSFIHMVAFAGHLDYVVREADKDRTLLSSDEDLSILASSIAGNNIDLVEALIERGSSPAQVISCWRRDGVYRGTRADGSIPIWMSALQQDLAEYITWPRNIPNFDMWEVLLRDYRVHAHNCFVLLQAEGGDHTTYFVTLKQVIEELKPTNMNTLLTHLSRGRDDSYLSGMSAFLSRLIPAGRRSELSMTARVAEYSPYDLKDNRDMELTAIVCDDIHVETCYFRIF